MAMCHSPAAVYAAAYAEGINNSGEIVGFYVDSGGTDHAFLYNPNSATHWITLDDPNASQNFGQGTYAEGINNSGEIVGYYIDSGGTDHAFLYNPNSATHVDQFRCSSGRRRAGCRHAGLRRQ